MVYALNKYVKHLIIFIGLLLLNICVIAQTAGNISEADVTSAAEYINKLIADAGNTRAPFHSFKGALVSKQDGSAKYKVRNLNYNFIRAHYLLQPKGHSITYKAEFGIQATATIVKLARQQLLKNSPANAYDYLFSDKGRARGVYEWSIIRNGFKIASFRQDKYRNKGYLEVFAK